MTAPNSKTIVALDIGSRRIGVARADTTTQLPTPLPTLIPSGDILTAVLEYIGQVQPDIVVLGLPRGLSGQDTPQTGVIRRLQAQLSTQLSLPVYVQDEALTSHQAETQLKTAGQPYRRDDIDALSARLILADFLASEEGQRL